MTIGKKYRPNTSLFSHCLNFQPRVDTLLLPSLHLSIPFIPLLSTILPPPFPPSPFSRLFSRNTRRKIVDRAGNRDEREERRDPTKQGTLIARPHVILQSERLGHRERLLPDPSRGGPLCPLHFVLLAAGFILRTCRL